MSETELHDPQQQAILRTFRDAGLRITTQRLAILEVLRTADGFIDAETLYDLANQKDSSLSLATVYRTLALFKEMRLVEGRIVGDEQIREEYRFRSLHETYTMVCKNCGKIVPVESDIIDAFRRDLALTQRLTVLSANSCFIGYCADCMADMTAEDETATPSRAT
ncbi:MAG TPA: transcriptional repressor [Aggregatilineaceae bacterium]|nr:transcriptional repressor [Aggregatilineaceae bacterium]